MFIKPVHFTALILILLSSVGYTQPKVQTKKYPFADQLDEKYEVIETKDGSFLKNGYYKKWHTNGQLAITCNYKSNRKNGDYKSFYPNGNPKLVASYKADSLQGFVTEFNSNGNKMSEGTYSKDKKQGNFKYYFEQGHLYLEGNFENDIKVSLWKKYDLNNNLIRVFNYLNGKDKAIVGKWLLENGSKIEYHEDRKFTMYNPDNSISSSGTYYFRSESELSLSGEGWNNHYSIESLLENTYTIKEVSSGFGNQMVFKAQKITN